MKTSLAIFCLLILGVLSSCSPLRSSPNDEKHQLELTLHEMQTNLDDVRHDINCFQTELQILDGRIKYYENTLTQLKQHDLEKQQAKVDLLTQQIQALEKKWGALEKVQAGDTTTLSHLTAHANETSASLAQFKERIGELEKEIYAQNRRFDELAKGKMQGEKGRGTKNISYKTYRVKPGDSLEKIARSHKVPVEQIKKLNDLEQDLIVIGQELKIPLLDE